MKIEKVFQDGLRVLLKEKPLEDINVIMLCDFVKSNRQTFYYHFRDISDVVDATFLKAKVGYSKKLLDYESILKEMIAYISENYQYISAVNKSYAADKLYSFLFSYFYIKVGNILKNHNVSGNEIVRYISVLSSQELIFWISNKRKEKNASFIKRLNTIWRYLVNQYQSDLKRIY
mgnify:CR=1 FL=1